jgi:hypothetical protein
VQPPDGDFMSSKSGNTAKLLVGVTAFLAVVAAILTAILGAGRIPDLLKVMQSSPDNTNSQTTTSPSLSGTETSKASPAEMANANQSGYGVSQKSVDGNCNNIVVQGQVATIICSPKPNTPFGSRSFPQQPPSLEGTRSNIQLQATVAGLQRSSNKFTLMLTNNSSNQSVNISTHDLDISDDSGNTYDLDRLAMHGTDLSKTVPPLGRIKINYILSVPISNETTSLNFTLNDVWAQSRENQFPLALPQIQWKINL